MKDLKKKNVYTRCIIYTFVYFGGKISAASLQKMLLTKLKRVNKARRFQKRNEFGSIRHLVQNVTCNFSSILKAVSLSAKWVAHNA